MYLLSNRFDTVMKYEAQRFEKNYAESSTLGIKVARYSFSGSVPPKFDETFELV